MTNKLPLIPKLKLDFDGWAILQLLSPTETTPLVLELWQLASRDPNFYFQNGPGSCTGVNFSRIERFLTMLSLTSVK